jgi:hypothetical protein
MTDTRHIEISRNGIRVFAERGAKVCDEYLIPHLELVLGREAPNFFAQKPTENSTEEADRIIAWAASKSQRTLLGREI